MSLLAIRFERSLVGYLSSAIPSLPIHAGHSNGVQSGLPRATVTVTAGGGELVRGAGVDQLEVEVQILIASGEIGVAQSGYDLDPLLALAKFADGIRGALRSGNVADIEASLEADPNIIFNGIEYEGYKEGRDEERKLHGVIMTFKAWAGLAPV